MLAQMQRNQIVIRGQCGEQSSSLFHDCTCNHHKSPKVHLWVFSPEKLKLKTTQKHVHGCT